MQALEDAGLELIRAGGKSLSGGPGLRPIPVPEPEVAAAGPLDTTASAVFRLSLPEAFAGFDFTWRKIITEAARRSLVSPGQPGGSE